MEKRAERGGVVHMAGNRRARDPRGEGGANTELEGGVHGERRRRGRSKRATAMHEEKGWLGRRAKQGNWRAPAKWGEKNEGARFGRR